MGATVIFLLFVLRIVLPLAMTLTLGMLVERSQPREQAGDM